MWGECQDAAKGAANDSTKPPVLPSSCLLEIPLGLSQRLWKGLGACARLKARPPVASCFVPEPVTTGILIIEVTRIC